MNAYDMLQLLRDNIHEATATHWSDVNLVRRLNQAQNRVAQLVAMSPGQWLVKSKSVTASNSVITLPDDCSKPLYLEDANGNPIHWLGSVTHRRVSRAAGTSIDIGAREAYPLMSTIEVNEDSFGDTCTLWYLRRVPNLHTGTAGTNSGSSALEFDSDLNLVYLDDYYNDVTVEVIDQSSGIVDIRSTISDYVASTRIATISGIPSSGDLYGTISVLPEETHDLIVVWATVLALMKPASEIDENVRKYYQLDLRSEKTTVTEWLASRIPGDGVIVGDPY